MIATSSFPPNPRKKTMSEKKSNIDFFFEHPILCTLFIIPFVYLEGLIFQYSLYSLTGRDISVWADIIISSLICFVIRIHISESSKINIGGMIIIWSFLICWILRYFFSVEAPFFHI